jgi:putative alpha-1,2-mannosidase
VREVQTRTFGDTTPYGGYNGDEDQGQMGALGVLMAIGLFDVEGGASVKPTYQITSPLFDRVTIHLNRRYFPGEKFVITTRHNSAENIYIQSARLNARPLDQVSFAHSELVAGGELEIDLGPQPSHWATDITLVPTQLPSAAQ